MVLVALLALRCRESGTHTIQNFEMVILKVFHLFIGYFVILEFRSTDIYFFFIYTASENALRNGRGGEVLDVSRYGTLGSGGDLIKSNPGEEEMNYHQIRRHLQNLELELSSMVGSLRSNTFASEKVYSATCFVIE